MLLLYGKTTQLKQNDGIYEIEIPEEYVTKSGWENRHHRNIR